MTAERVSLFLQAQRGLFLVILIVLGLLFFAALMRAVKGPRVADRLVAVNMIGTMVMVMIAVLSLYWQEEYLLDICLIYAMASFLAVIVLSKVYIGIYEEQHLVKSGMSRADRGGRKVGTAPESGMSDAGGAKAAGRADLKSGVESEPESELESKHGKEAGTV